MKVMLVCGAGVSTSILMKKMLDYAGQNNIDLEVKAYGFDEAVDYYDQYECVLVGPQISYRLNEIKSICSKPCAAINSIDYGMGNAGNVIKSAQDLLK